MKRWVFQLKDRSEAGVREERMKYKIFVELNVVFFGSAESRYLPVRLQTKTQSKVH